MRIKLNPYKLQTEVLKKGVRVKDIAAKTGLSTTTVTRVCEYGMGTMSTLQKIVHALGLNVNDYILPIDDEYERKLDYDKIQSMLKAKGITYDELGRRLGLSKQAVWRSLKTVRPNEARVKAVAEILGVNPNELYIGD